jgi:hypothetical protein
MQRPVPTPARRFHPRKRLAFIYIHFTTEGTGTILYLGKNGLCMQAITPPAEGFLPRMRFQPSESRDWPPRKRRHNTGSRVEKIGECPYGLNI